MTSWDFLYSISLTGSRAGEQLGVKSSSRSSCWMLYYSPQCSLFSPYTIELTCISNRDQICKHCRAGCNCCQVLEVIDDVVTGPYSRSGWALVPQIASPWYCYLFTAEKDRSLLSTILLHVLASLLLPRIFLLCIKRKWIHAFRICTLCSVLYDSNPVRCASGNCINDW